MVNKWLSSSNWPIEAAKTGTANLGESGQVRNSNEEVLLIPKTPRLIPHH